MSTGSRTASSSAAERIVVSDTGLCCAAGDQALGAWSAAALHLSAAEPDESTVVPCASGQGDAPALVAPVADVVASELAGAERLAELLERAAADLSLEGLDTARVRLCLARSPAASARGRVVSDQALRDACAERWPALIPENIRIVDAHGESGQGLAGTSLADARRALTAGECDAVLFGGVDSLITRDTCLELSNQDRLMSQGDVSGIVPGEAAALVVLETESRAHQRGVPVRAVLSAAAAAPEPHPGEADLYAATGLPAAIEAALAAAGIAAADIGGLVLSAGLEIADSLELYQTTQRLWPCAIDEQQRLALQLEEISPQELVLPDDPVPPELSTARAFGELGAAALPLQLLLAAEWFAVERRLAAFGLSGERRHLLVCETGEAPHRGAVVISEPPSPSDKPTRTGRRAA